MYEERITSQKDEIDLIELIKGIWSRKWFITKLTGIFTALGLVIAFTSPKEFTASSVLIVESTSNEGSFSGSLGNLASLAGIKVGDVSKGLSIDPALYESIVKSRPFMLSLMQTNFYFDDLGKEIILSDYFLNHLETGLISKVLSFPFTAINFFKPKNSSSVKILEGEDLEILTEEEVDIIENLRNRLVIFIDFDLNLIRIECEMQDPFVAAKITVFAQNYLTDYAKAYAQSKGQEQLTFIKKQFELKKWDFERIQTELASFRDNNKYVNTERSKTEEERLEARYNVAYGIYNQLAQQLEAKQIQINENIPVFTVLEPVLIPEEKSAPRRGLIIIGMCLAGIILSLTIELARVSFGGE